MTAMISKNLLKCGRYIIDLLFSQFAICQQVLVLLKISTVTCVTITAVTLSLWVVLLFKMLVWLLLIQLLLMLVRFLAFTLTVDSKEVTGNEMKGDEAGWTWTRITWSLALALQHASVPLCYSGSSRHVSGYLSIVDATERAPLVYPGPLSDGQFYSPPESVAGLLTHTDINTQNISHWAQDFLLDSQVDGGKNEQHTFHVWFSVWHLNTQVENAAPPGGSEVSLKAAKRGVTVSRSITQHGRNFGIIFLQNLSLEKHVESVVQSWICEQLFTPSWNMITLIFLLPFQCCQWCYWSPSFLVGPDLYTKVMQLHHLAEEIRAANPENSFFWQNCFWLISLVFFFTF